jgi:arylsulfatase A-like enzyme
LLRSLGALAALAGCGRTETIDLASRLDGAELHHECLTIDFGTPPAREHLAAGWGADEKWGEASFVWAFGETSSVDFYVGVPRPLTLRMRCWPLPFSGLPPQTVAVAVNGTALATFTLQEGQAEYSVTVPAASLRRGVNRLDFQYAYARRPIDLDPNQLDPRPLAVAWDWLTFDGLTDATAPSTPMGGTLGELVLPPNSEASFYLDLPDGGILEIGDIVPIDGAPSAAALDVEAQGAEGGSAVVTRFDPSGSVGGQHWTIPSRGLLRLTFRPRAGAGGVRVVRPEIRRPPTPPARACDAAAPAPRTPGAPVLIFLIDTLRADHLGCYGYSLPISPHIDAFAHDAVRFAHAVAQSSWTKPSVASILTGLTPRHHGANGRRGVLGSVPTLPAALANAGYFTQGIVTNSVVAADFGFAQGFADYRLLEERPLAAERGIETPPGVLTHQGADTLRRAAETWLDGRSAPFFLYLHATDPHDPYVPPSAFRERWAAGVDPRIGLTGFLERILAGQYTPTAADRNGLIALYDAEIAFVDQEFGALLDDLRERGLYDSALIILVGDHGEAFNEHGSWHHGTTLFREETAVPLLIKFPQQWHAGAVEDAVVQHVDIAPTILETVGVPSPNGDGRSLLSTLACSTADRSSDHSPVGYAYLGGDGFGVDLESIIAGDRKLIHFATADRPRRRLELYDLGRDPAEEHDLSETDPIEAAYLFSLMAPFRRQPAAPDAQRTPVDPAVLERLRALGYGKGL